MSKKKEKQNQSQESTFENVEQALSRTERFVEKNQKIITTIAVVAAVVVLGYYGYQKYIYNPKVLEAQEQTFPAEQYFKVDSFRLALNGDGNALGFIDIIDEYGSTPSGNIAKYYAGICNLHIGNYSEAIDYLKSYSSEDIMISITATGAIGDAYVQSNELEKGAGYYVDAADMFPNKFTTPVYLMKAAQVYYKLENIQKALELYKRIKTEFPDSRESRSIDKYIARAELKLRK